MKTRFTLTTLLAALTVLGLGITPALADSGQGTILNTFFTELPDVVAKPTRGSTAMVKAQSDASIGFYATTADSGYEYPDFWGNMPSHPVSKAPAGSQAHGAGVGTYVTETNHGTWLFPPDPWQ